MSDKSQQLSGNRLQTTCKKIKTFFLSLRGFFFQFFNVLINVLNFFVCFSMCF